MAVKKEIDVRDAIMKHLETIERNLAWLSKKSKYPYATLYSIFVLKTFALSDEKRIRISAILNIKF